jgi:hypothetical protein
MVLQLERSISEETHRKPLIEKCMKNGYKSVYVEGIFGSASAAGLSDLQRGCTGRAVLQEMY